MATQKLKQKISTAVKSAKAKCKGMFDEIKRIVTPSEGIRKFIFNPKTYKYHFSESGNIKVGRIATWSTLMGDYTYKGLRGVLRNIVGTCVNCRECGCVKACYVRASYRFPSVIYSQAVNTWGLRHAIDKVANDLAEQLSKGKINIVRINQSGEIENEEQLSMWCTLAGKFPKIPFYLYTKNFDAVTKFLKDGLVPGNFTILFSVWHETGVKEYNSVKHLPNVKAFVYDDKKNLVLVPKTYCPAYKDGKLDHDWTCERCGLCFRSKVKIVGCADH